MAPDDDSRFRPDAALVFRSLRDDGPATATTLVERLFPTPDAPPTTQKYIRKAGWRRVIDSLVWMRHHGVTVWAVPDASGTIFSLERLAVTVPAPVRADEPEDFWHPTPV